MEPQPEVLATLRERFGSEPKPPAGPTAPEPTPQP
jgi:hypothetical protein